MRKAVVVAALFLLAPSAQAQEMQATRAYKLCLMEGPQCVPILMAAYRRAVPKVIPAGMVADANHDQRCVDGFRTLSAQQVALMFMTAGSAESPGRRYFLDGTIDVAMSRVLSAQAGMECFKRDAGAPSAAPAPATTQPSELGIRP